MIFCRTSSSFRVTPARNRSCRCSPPIDARPRPTDTLFSHVANCGGSVAVGNWLGVLRALRAQSARGVVLNSNRAGNFRWRISGLRNFSAKFRLAFSRLGSISLSMRALSRASACSAPPFGLPLAFGHPLLGHSLAQSAYRHAVDPGAGNGRRGGRHGVDAEGVDADPLAAGDLRRSVGMNRRRSVLPDRVGRDRAA